MCKVEVLKCSHLFSHIDVHLRGNITVENIYDFCDKLMNLRYEKKIFSEGFT